MRSVGAYERPNNLYIDADTWWAWPCCGLRGDTISAERCAIRKDQIGCSCEYGKKSPTQEEIRRKKEDVSASNKERRVFSEEKFEDVICCCFSKSKHVKHPKCPAGFNYHLIKNKQGGFCRFSVNITSLLNIKVCRYRKRK